VGERERIRRKQKSVDKSDAKEGIVEEQETETQIETESMIHEEMPIIETEAEIEKGSIVETKSEIEMIVEEPRLLPSWGDISQTEWMYHIPVREEDLQMWASEWSDFVLEWCEEYSIHILSFSKFVSEYPFKDIQNKADAYRKIGDKIVEKEVGIWMEGKKRQLRVYWRFLEEWADIIYQWALENGRTRLDVKSIVIQENKQNFAKLPEKEIHYVIKLLVERELAEWIDKQKGAVRLVL